MGQRTEEIKKQICRAFPKLASDQNFIVTSKPTPEYNCIAWAYSITNRWMWPNTGEHPFLDGVHYWPDNSIMEPTIENFINAFKLKGYELCDNGDFEEGYQKVALYAQPGSDVCTHAARQLRNGFWTSKLGKYEDIQHGTAYSIENQVYGEVRCFMKRIFQ